MNRPRHRIGITLIALLASVALAGDSTADRAGAATDRFEYYGWFYVGYGRPGEADDLERLAAYTNTAFARNADQAGLLRRHGYKHVVYAFEVAQVLRRVWQGEGKPMPARDAYGVVWHERLMDGFREKFFTAYQRYMGEVKSQLIEAQAYADVDIFFIADEPALHRNVYLDQAFLDRCVAEFKREFPDKKCLIAFAGNSGEPYPATGPHFDPPEGCDIVCVQPFFTSRSPDLPDVACDEDSVRRWLYEDSPASTVAWAKRFGKPIVVVGDARVQGGKPPKECWVRQTYNILRKDPAVRGIIWFVYDRDYTERGNHGLIRGAASDPRLVELIRDLDNERPADETCLHAD